MKVLFLSVEVAPLAKAGGLADVAGSLPVALRALGHDVRVAMPAYSFIDRAAFGLEPVREHLHVSFAGGTQEAQLLRGAIGNKHPLSASGEEQTSEVSEIPLISRHPSADFGSLPPLYLVDQPAYFDRDNIYGYDDDAQRFLFFCRAALRAVQALNWVPDVVHCNDWHSGAVPVWISDDNFAGSFFARTATVYTIHNLAYQGVFPASVWDVTGEPAVDPGEFVNFMALGIGHAGAITTVSPTYAREILTPQRGEGLHDLLRSRLSRLHGILNGLDVTVFDPANDPALVRQFDADHLEDRAANKHALQKRLALVEGDHFLLGMVSRLADQKGFDLLIEALPNLLSDTEVQFVLLGAGDSDYAARLTELAHRFPRQVSINLGYDAILAQHIYAGSDAFLMPSRYEPCGLGQMIALRYGSVPIVRATGGLADTVQDFEPATGEGTGFVFRPYEAGALLDAIRRAHHASGDRNIWRALQRRGMSADFSWDSSARKYAAVYEEASLLR